MKLWLAPMEGVTDCAFRTLCYNHGADLTYTEMIRVDALVKNNKSTLNLLDLKNDTPTVIQLLAVKPEILQKFINNFPKYNLKPAGFDLNLGCPSPDIIRQGAGAALLKRTQRVQELIAILKKTELPISVKMRLGLNQYEKEKKVYLNILNNIDADYFIIHARHGCQASSEKADWTIYQECIDTGKHIIPNGDIFTKEHLKYFQNLKIKEIMIGRAAVKNPAIFEYLKYTRTTNLNKIKEEYLKLIQTYPSPEKYKRNVFNYLGKNSKATNL